MLLFTLYGNLGIGVWFFFVFLSGGFLVVFGLVLVNWGGWVSGVVGGVGD